MRPTSGEVPHRCARYQRLVGISIDVRSWHFSDMHPHRRMSAIEGKADIVARARGSALQRRFAA
jgi:hypothetical protein